MSLAQLSARPPHPHRQSQQRLWGLGGLGDSPDGDPILEHCRACARAILAALEDIKFARPEEIQGLL